MMQLRRLSLLLVALVLALSVEAAKPAKVNFQPSKGATVYGRVLCDGEPVVGVTVSDGALFATTDSLGRYELPSLKYHNAVFITTPSGYEPVCRRGVLPQFWALLDSRKPEKVERHDFELKRVDNQRHRMVVTADAHLAGRNEDLLQLKRTVMPALQRIAEEAKCDSLPIYSIMLGDLGISQWWYSGEFDVDDALSSLVSSRYPFMLYTAMGELDHDGAIPASPMTDHLAEEAYICACGPRFYSMNIGCVHYIVLDTTVFLNEAGDGKYPTEIVGTRNYERRVSADQLAWLRRDLSQVTDKTAPVVVCMHHGAFRANTKGKISKTFTKPEDTDSLTVCFKEFSNVHFLSAHQHRRRVSKASELPNIVDHNISALGGNAWETGYNYYPHICADGMDAGVEIFTIDGDSLSWQSRSIENGDRTFRIYDMAAVSRYYRKMSDIRNMLRDVKSCINYGTDSFRDYVYINYWGEEPGSKLEVFAGKKRLKMRQVYQDDPTFTIASSVVRHRNSRGRKVSINKANSQHMFRVKVDSTMKCVRVRATDSFGRVFEDSLIRPSKFVPTTNKRAKIK